MRNPNKGNSLNSSIDTDNNKERLKNNILIKIEFWDVRGIVEWDDIYTTI